MGGPNSDTEAEKEPQEREEGQELDIWRFRDIYIQASAAGVSDAEFNRLTLSKTIAKIEANQLNRFWFAKPILTAMLPHLSEDALKSIVRPSKSGGNNLAGKAMQILMRDYMTPTMLSQEKGYARAKAESIPGLPKVVALGIMKAYQRGDFNDNVVWVSINPYFTRISATAKKG